MNAEGGIGSDAGRLDDAGAIDSTTDSSSVDAGAGDGSVDQDAGPCIDVTSVSGSVVDESNSAFNGAAVTLCVETGNSSACLSPKSTDAAGSFTIPVPAALSCLQQAAYEASSSALPGLVPMYCPVDPAAGGAVTTARPAKLVQAPACTRDPLGDTAAPHLIASPSGASITVIPDQLMLFGQSYDDIRFVVWDHAKWGWPCFIDPANPPDGLIGFTPVLDVMSKGALQVSFPNDLKLAPGTTVDLYALGGGGTFAWDGTLVHEGHWRVIGQARVTSDGSRIESLPGEGLPFGTWVGWKQR